MKKIIDNSTKQQLKFSKEDLPILIHGKNHSGASLLSITLVSGMHEDGNKFCIFTAYPMAKEEFLKQIKDYEKVFYLEKEEDFERASKFQTIIIQSGNINLFIKTISNFYLMSDRIVFIKNIETIHSSIFKLILRYPFIVSGDIELNQAQQDFKNYIYRIKILFNPIKGEKIPALEKYQALVKGKPGDKVVTVQEREG